MDRAAELAGISCEYVGQVERGSVDPTLAVLGKIASGLHVPLELLIENREEAPATLYRAVDRGRAAPLAAAKSSAIPCSLDTDSRSEAARWIFSSAVSMRRRTTSPALMYLTVLSGTVKVACGGEVFRLESRDCLSLPGAGGAAVCQRGQHHRAAAGVDSLP